MNSVPAGPLCLEALGDLPEADNYECLIASDKAGSVEDYEVKVVDEKYDRCVPADDILVGDLIKNGNRN